MFNNAALGSRFATWRYEVRYVYLSHNVIHNVIHNASVKGESVRAASLMLSLSAARATHQHPSHLRQRGTFCRTPTWRSLALTASTSHLRSTLPPKASRKQNRRRYQMLLPQKLGLQGHLAADSLGAHTTQPWQWCSGFFSAADGIMTIQSHCLNSFKASLFIQIPRAPVPSSLGGP